jgi:opacity protein-like surface antigen
MKRTILAFFAALFLFSGAVLADDKIAFTEFGISYGSVIDPSYISNNTTGVLDTAVFDAKAGVEILKWADVYAGAGFHLYLVRTNWQEHYTFFPLCGGVRVNIMPDWCVYPVVFGEYGAAFSNRRTIVSPITDHNDTWIAGYYNFGIGVNWKVEDIATL